MLSILCRLLFENTHDRQEIKILREGASLNKEHLTTQWLSESITELRNEVAELQESQVNVTRTLMQTRTTLTEEINEMKDELATVRLEMKASRERQQKTDYVVKELQDEAIQHVEDVKKYMIRHKDSVSTTFIYLCFVLITTPNLLHDNYYHSGLYMVALEKKNYDDSKEKKSVAKACTCALIR